MLKDESQLVRRYTAFALRGQNQLSDAISYQIYGFLRGGKVLTSSASALGGQKQLSNAILQQMVELLKDEASEVRNAAVDVLGDQQRLPDAILQQIVELLKDEASEVRNAAANALRGQKELSDVILAQISELLKDKVNGVRSAAANTLRRQKKLSDAILQQIVELLKDEAIEIRRAAAEALGGQQQLSNEWINRIIELLKDKDHEVRRHAIYALGMQKKLSNSCLKQIAKLLKDKNKDVRRYAWQALYNAPTYIWRYGFPYVVNQSRVVSEDRYNESAYQYRIPLYEVAGTDSSIIYLRKWLCRPYKYPVTISIEEARKTLDLMLGFEVSPDSNLLFREEVSTVLPKLYKAAEAGWTKDDLPRLNKALAFLNYVQSPSASFFQEQVNALESQRWGKRLLGFIVIHLSIWSLLLFAYPYSSIVQATFFWNPTVRKWFGLGYVGLMISRIPWLQNRIFAPFQENLIAEIYTDNWQEAEYFPDSKVYAKKKKETLTIKEALIPLHEQNILEGESGLGKSMFLRNLAIHANRIVVYLPATRCMQGIIPAIEHKLPITASDPAWLRSLVYAGAMDILIDGLNEVSAETRSQIKLEVERNIKGHILLTTQPMEWEPPVAAKQFVLQPLGEKQVTAFLLSRYPYLEQKELIPESAFQDHSKAYLKAAFDSELDTESLKSNRHILSNPMDLTLVAQLIARGEKPSLLDLQQQQYRLMAKDYKLKNMQQDFPLAKFSSQVYQMRIDDQAEIPHQGFEAAMTAMQKWKMVVSRITQEADPRITSWYFRHDKIMDYFLLQEFLNNKDVDLKEKHLDDPRFRGVYFLLAYELSYEDAMALRERIIQHSVESKNRSLLDNFVMLLRGKKPPRSKELEFLRNDIKDLIADGKPAEAIQLLRSRVNGTHEDEAAMLGDRNTQLEEEIRQGTISSADAILQRNKLNKDILDFVRGVS